MGHGERPGFKESSGSERRTKVWIGAGGSDRVCGPFVRERLNDGEGAGGVSEGGRTGNQIFRKKQRGPIDTVEEG